MNLGSLLDDSQIKTKRSSLSPGRQAQITNLNVSLDFGKKSAAYYQGNQSVALKVSRGKSLYSPTSTRKKSLKRYTAKKASSGNIDEFYIDKNALRQMSLNLKKLHDDIIITAKPDSSTQKLVRAYAFPDQPPTSQAVITQMVNSATIKKKHQPSQQRQNSNIKQYNIPTSSSSSSVQQDGTNLSAPSAILSRKNQTIEQLDVNQFNFNTSLMGTGLGGYNYGRATGQTRSVNEAILNFQGKGTALEVATQQIF